MFKAGTVSLKLKLTSGRLLYDMRLFAVVALVARRAGQSFVGLRAAPRNPMVAARAEEGEPDTCRLHFSLSKDIFGSLLVRLLVRLLVNFYCISLHFMAFPFPLTALSSIDLDVLRKWWPPRATASS